LPLGLALLTGGCATGYAEGYAPDYPPGYDQGMGSGNMIQPGDLFGGQNVASIDVFFEPLSPYGRWVNSRFGRSFQPDAPREWRPYVNGRWGDDRLWISDDPWGWATDHYGRWGFDEQLGWVWAPDTEWAPSWVAWREADDVTGWAPIPPGISYSVGIGFGGGFGYDNWNSWYGPSWVWVPRNNLYQRGFGGGILPWNRGYDYWRGSRWNYQSGWNGRSGYGSHPNWNSNRRPGGYYQGRPGQWNGQQGQGRPRIGGSIGESIGGSIGGVQPRGGFGGVPPRGDFGGVPPRGDFGGVPPRGDFGGVPPRGRPDGNWQGNGRPGVDQQPRQPYGSQWQGRPGGTRPDGSNWQGGRRPEASQPQGQVGGPVRRGQGGSGSIGEAIGSGMISQPVPQRPAGGNPAGMGYRPAPQAAQIERPAPQAAPSTAAAPPQQRVERPAPPSRAERPEGQRRSLNDDRRRNERPQ
jgi:hypothetical protein